MGRWIDFMGLIAGLYFIAVAVFSTEMVPRLYGVALGGAILWVVIGNRQTGEER